MHYLPSDDEEYKEITELIQFEIQDDAKSKPVKKEKVIIVCPICNGSYFESHKRRHEKTKSHSLSKTI
jgi:hypothetical protein